jgi:hypothetical protein
MRKLLVLILCLLILSATCQSAMFYVKSPEDNRGHFVWTLGSVLLMAWGLDVMSRSEKDLSIYTAGYTMTVMGGFGIYLEIFEFE